jgi:hypothetical protein
VATDLERIDELLSGQEAEVRRAFLDYVRLVQSDKVMAQIEALLVAQDIAGAFKVVESYISRFGDVLPRIQQHVGDATAVELAAILPPAIHVALSFDSSNLRAAQLVRTQRLGLVSELSRSQLATIQQALNRGLSEGAGTAKLARAFREAIGLTAGQENAVSTYRRALELSSREALGRALRDRRYDGRVQQAVEENRPLTQIQMDRMVDRYRARSLAARAETIARTEAGRAVAEAREEAVEQMAEATGIKRERVIRIWHATGDERTRDWHQSMDGQKRGLDEPFVDGLGNRLRYPHDPNAPPATTINCRCPLTYEIAPPA